MSEWLWRVSTVATGRIVAWLIIALITSAGFSLAAHSSWQYLKTAPWPVMSLVVFGIAGAILFVAFLVAALLYAPIGPGVYGSKYLLWYKNPIRKISWNFAQFLGASWKSGSPIVINTFQAQFRVNRGEGIAPKKAYLECKRTGVCQDLLLKPLNSYVKAGDVAFIPSGRWFQCQSPFGEMNKESFLNKYDGFTLVFEYDDQIFRRRFSRRELEQWIDRYWRYNNPPPMPRGSLRTEQTE